MGKPSPTRDTSFRWNYIPRHIAHRVAMHQQCPNAADAFIPKMAKQNFAMDTGLYIRMLKWKAIPEVLHNEDKGRGCVGQTGACSGRISSTFGTYLATANGQSLTNEKCKEKLRSWARSCLDGWGTCNPVTNVSNTPCLIESTISCDST